MDSESRILVVDDEAVFARNLARILRGRGYTVETAPDGESAVATVEKDPNFAVALLDVKMPGMGGIEALRRIKTLAPGVEAIMLTGHATVESGIEAIREGAFDYLMKPCDVEHLVEKIEAARSVERIRKRPVLWVRSTAGDILLTDFSRLSPDAPLTAALAVFNRDRDKMAAETLFVTDAEDRPAGCVTQRSLLGAAQGARPEKKIGWEQLLEHPQWLPDRPLAEVMHPEVVFVEVETSLQEAARRMIDRRIRTMPVVEEGRVVGIVRLTDALRYLEPDSSGEESD
ncbi:MAG: response regulator [Desulfobacterales bacterium]|nr:response regulator [Desulfobacterales bacterium]